MNMNMEIALLHKLLKQTTAAYEEQLNQLALSQRALRESETRLQTILDNIDAYVYLKDLDGRYLYVNQVTCRLWNVTLDEAVGCTDEKFFDADSAAAIRVNDQHALAQGDVLKIEETNRVQDSVEVRHYLSAKMPLRDEDGTIYALLGVSTDITERVRAEEQLRLAALVYDNSSEAVMVTDRDDRVIAVNPAFEALTGYRSAEVVGHSPRMLRSGLQPAEFYRRMWEDLQAGGVWKGEIWNRRKNGDPFAALLAINTIFSEGGEVEKRVALYSDITEKKHTDDMIWRHANFDELTQLPNRRLFTELLGRQIKVAKRTDSRFALMFLDLDRFKEINDTLGHHAGDELLAQTARRIRDCVRETDIVARLGGDEFVVVLLDVVDPEDMERVSNGMIQTMRRVFEVGEQTVYTSISIGVTIFPQDADDAATLLRNADQAMYASKRDGRSRYRYFHPSMQSEANQRMRLGNELRLALERNELFVAYQPIVDLHSGEVAKAEGLIRWQHPDYGLVPPLEFIPLAEELGLIHDIDRWVFEQAVGQVNEWRRHFRADFQINVNKSAVAFHDDAPEMIRHLAELKDAGIGVDGVVVEITEGTLLHVGREVSRHLLALRDAGVEVAVDDFGTGYSSLAYLQKLDIDYLKIDRSFVQNLATDSTDLTLTEAIVMMAHRLGLKVVAEGVESDEQVVLLRQMGCDFAQGFVFAKPLEAGEFENIVFAGDGLSAATLDNLAEDVGD